MPFRLLLLCVLCLSAVGCLHAPPAGYADTPRIEERRLKLAEQLLTFLPPQQQSDPAAQAEARWLADTAYKGAAAIARHNNPSLKGWFNNMQVNSKDSWKERGLCWHYQHDMYRELRRRPLHFFRIGCGVMDRARGSEHHCVYLAAKDGGWPNIVILDAWINNGRLKLVDTDIAEERHWEEEPAVLQKLKPFYPEGHTQPLEHWALVREGRKVGIYVYCNTPEGETSRQGQLMRENMKRGLQERGGKPVPY